MYISPIEKQKKNIQSTFVRGRLYIEDLLFKICDEDHRHQSALPVLQSC